LTKILKSGLILKYLTDHASYPTSASSAISAVN